MLILLGFFWNCINYIKPLLKIVLKKNGISGRFVYILKVRGHYLMGIADEI